MDNLNYNDAPADEETIINWLNSCKTIDDDFKKYLAKSLIKDYDIKSLSISNELDDNNEAKRYIIAHEKGRNIDKTIYLVISPGIVILGSVNGERATVLDCIPKPVKHKSKNYQIKKSRFSK